MSRTISVYRRHYFGLMTSYDRVSCLPGDERFSFLRSSHQHHAYYRQKLEQYERDLGKTKPASGTAPAKIQKTEDKANKPGTVCLSWVSQFLCWKMLCLGIDEENL